MGGLEDHSLYEFTYIPYVSYCKAQLDHADIKLIKPNAMNRTHGRILLEVILILTTTYDQRNIMKTCDDEVFAIR